MSKASDFTHIPVLFNECMEYLDIKPDGVYVDCTAGGGGHSMGILERLSPEGRLISLDKDEDALETCREKKRLAGADNWIIVRSDFSDIKNVLDETKLEKADGILADLGVSSHQIDTPDRGFSYAVSGPLDMRMDQNSPLTAEIVVNEYREEDLARIFKLYGEERYSGRIAAGICRDRRTEPFKDTVELAKKIASYVPSKARNEDQHPARRCFQAIRIEVNHELASVERLLKDAPSCLRNGGRIAVISFHSLEDRLVKESFRELEDPCTCPRDFPVCVCGKKSLGKVITKKPVTAGAEEIRNNSRAHCCKLRVFERQEETEE
ncbi:MAG: 16S rRNA (cytosine(1402)-N(4))-methyltransferase RsmH [Clostridiales bacterium]|nr:16S rRNA (cytosine(1402)-N(4))-methyltransferase RsmH [Clostridiales bacterium]